jgi:hypothetical protein
MRTRPALPALSSGTGRRQAEAVPQHPPGARLALPAGVLRTSTDAVRTPGIHGGSASTSALLAIGFQPLLVRDLPGARGLAGHRGELQRPRRHARRALADPGQREGYRFSSGGIAAWIGRTSGSQLHNDARHRRGRRLGVVIEPWIARAPVLRPTSTDGGTATVDIGREHCFTRAHSPCSASRTPSTRTATACPTSASPTPTTPIRATRTPTATGSPTASR